MSLNERIQRSASNDAIAEHEHVQGHEPNTEFRREIKRFASFAAGFSCISITTGIFTTYGSALGWGGPRSIWTWPLVTIGQLLVALVFAALSSRIPIAGYSYQWISRLANPKLGWLVGWLSLTFLLLVVVTIDYALAQTVFPRLFNYVETPINAWIITAIIIILQMILILTSTLWSTRINNAAVVLLASIHLTLFAQRYMGARNDFCNTCHRPGNNSYKGDGFRYICA